MEGVTKERQTDRQRDRERWRFKKTRRKGGGEERGEEKERMHLHRELRGTHSPKFLKTT